MTGLLVQVRGASGSGKSTLVRAWVEEHGPPLKYMMSGAANFGLAHIDCPPSRPYALACPIPDRPRVLVPGHYEASGGGADMIKNKAHIYDVVDKGLDFGHNVLMESLFISKDVAETTKRYAGGGPVAQNIRILYLEVPEEECLASVHERRTRLGREYRPMRQHARDYAEVAKAVAMLEKQGANVERHSRASCAVRVRELLG